MEYGFAILMLIFGGVLLLYGLLMYVTGDYKMVPYRARQSAKVDNEKQYARQIAKVVMLTALAPMIAGACGFLPPLRDTALPPIILLVLSVLFIWLGVRLVRRQLPY